MVEKIQEFMSKYSLKKLFKEEMSKAYTIYCDMDGVLCDFEQRFEQFTGLSPNEYRSQKTIELGSEQKADEQFWDIIDNQVGVRFWVGIPWMPDGEELWKYIKKYKPTLLSSPSRSESSRLGKRLWVRNNLPGTKLILARAAEKQKYSGPNSILIDDREDNIQQWKSRNGIGILFKSTQQVIGELSKLGL